MPKMSIAEYNAANKETRAIADCGEALYKAMGNAEEFAHDGEYLPEEYRAAAYRIAAQRAIEFADYLDRDNAKQPKIDTGDPNGQVW